MVLTTDYVSGLTTENQSLFTYDEGKTYNSYLDISYAPAFLDAKNLAFKDAALEKEANEVCGNNMQCLFDIHTTGKVSIGLASKQSMDEYVVVVNETERVGE